MKLVISAGLMLPSGSMESQRSQMVVAPMVTGYSQLGQPCVPHHPAPLTQESALGDAKPHCRRSQDTRTGCAYTSGRSPSAEYWAFAICGWPARGVIGNGGGRRLKSHRLSTICEVDACQARHGPRATREGPCSQHRDQWSW